MLLLAAVASFSACKRHKPVDQESMAELQADLANEKDDEAGLAAVHQLEVTADPAALGILIDTLQNRSDKIRIAAASALGKSKDPRAADALAAVTQDRAQDQSVRFAAAQALGVLHDGRAGVPLVQALRFNEYEAIRSLLDLGPLAVPALIDALGHPDTSASASKLLIRMGSTGVDGLIELLNHNAHPFERSAAASTLAEIEDPRSIKALSQALKSGDLFLTAAAYRFLIRKGDAGSEGQMIKALNAYGKLAMAEDFVASGNPVLKAAAEDWAQKGKRVLQGRTSELDVVYWGGADPSIKRLALFHFDGALKSTSGAGSSQSVGVSFVPGKWGSALSVALGGVVKYPITDNLSFTDGTIEMWISPRLDGADPTFTKYNHPLLLYMSAANDQFLVSGSTLGGFYAGSVVRKQFVGTGGGNIHDWKAGSWHHIAFTYSSSAGRQRFYVDGTLTGENKSPMAAPDPGAGSFTVGCYPNADFLPAFLVDELQISSGEKSPGAILGSALRTDPFPDHP
jgi:Concanavalin A-like lectin/glucanases superfamily/HEAT repeats/PBS lyase HEAT-like repeat